ncbi:MAG: hypothetical protein ACPGSM_10230 [Thiolinea sp.]
MRSISINHLRAIILATSMTCMTTAIADDVSDAIDEASKAYESGDVNTAVENLNFAVQLLQQMKGEKLSELLPEALDGWTAGEAESAAVGAAMFGGGLTAKRSYQKDKSKVKIEIVTDSPMIQSMVALFTNPLFGASGGKMTKINGHKAMLEYNKKRQKGEYKLMINNRYMVTVNGRKVEADELKAYVEAIPFDEFEK